VLVGDRQQHRAVEAGSPFALLIDRAGIATERLDVIRRQRDEALREVVRVASEAGGADRAVQLLERAGRVVEIPDARLRHEQITRDFIADGGRGVVIAPSNAERSDLNRRIREALIEAGRVERKSVKAPVVVRQDLTREQKGRVSSYGVGDMLRFVRSGQGVCTGKMGVGARYFASTMRCAAPVETRTREPDPRERAGVEPCAGLGGRVALGGSGRKVSGLRGADYGKTLVRVQEFDAEGRHADGLSWSCPRRMGGLEMRGLEREKGLGRRGATEPLVGPMVGVKGEGVDYSLLQVFTGERPCESKAQRLLQGPPEPLDERDGA
jgi:AAA domain-containing protein